MALAKSQQSLKSWTKQKWRTKSGKPSAKTGERYLPEKAIKSLTPAEYAATTRAKREGKRKQYLEIAIVTFLLILGLTILACLVLLALHSQGKL